MMHTEWKMQCIYLLAKIIYNLHIKRVGVTVQYRYVATTLQSPYFGNKSVAYKHKM